MTATEFAPRTDGVGKRYRKGWALRDCTLALLAGGVIALVGPNGAGKTTLLRLVVGPLALRAGQAVIALVLFFSIAQHVQADGGVLDGLP